MIFSYIVCEANTPSALALEVQARMSEGYQCVGGVALVGGPIISYPSSVLFVQAMQRVQE